MVFACEVTFALRELFCGIILKNPSKALVFLLRKFFVCALFLFSYLCLPVSTTFDIYTYIYIVIFLPPS